MTKTVIKAAIVAKSQSWNKSASSVNSGKEMILVKETVLVSHKIIVKIIADSTKKCQS